MLASGIEILELIPQRPPMVMVDKLLSCDGQTTVTELCIKHDNVFAGTGRFSPPGLLESMAQTAAVRNGWIVKNNHDRKNKKVTIGVIGNIKHFKVCFQPVAGSVITTTAEVMYEIMQATIVKAKVETCGKLAAEGELHIFLTESEASR